MQAGTKLDVQWSPVHHDKFISWGSDITLYEVGPLQDMEKRSSCIKISSTSGATVLASQSASGVRCVDISHIAGLEEPLLALGHTSGRVSLTCVGQSADSLGLAGREFTPRYPRLCNSVSWSPTEPNLLAAALDKHRSDHCILVWDVHRGAPVATTPAGGPSSSAGGSEQRPLAEMGLSELAQGAAWAHSPRTLLASMNMKHIKIFDLRDLSNKAVQTVTSRYHLGACCDPLGPWQLAARGEGGAAVWDTRRLDRALLTLPAPAPLLKIAWCPSRRNVLCALLKDSPSLRLHCLQPPPPPPPDSEEVQVLAAAAAAEASPGCEAERSGGAAGGGGGSAQCRELCPAGGGAALAGFSWHPARQRLLAATNNGTIVDYTVCERVTIAWGAAGGLVYSGVGDAGDGGSPGGPAGSSTTLRHLPEAFYAQLNDISYVMKKRAQTDYGLKAELWQNAELAEDEALGGMWHFLALSRSLVEDGCIRAVGGNKHPGVCCALAGEGAYRSEACVSLLPDMPSRRATLYRSAERNRALQLCGWGWGWEQGGAAAAGAAGSPAGAGPGGAGAVVVPGSPRAAALAAFHLRVRAALDTLAKSPQPTLRLAALALAGLSDERMWRDTLPGTLSALPDPYLRAMLRFLAATTPCAAPPAAPPPPDVDAVLEETEMRLEDRVAFACLYLNDTKLRAYVRALAAQLAARGDLAGLLLTGLSSAGVGLLGRWAAAGGDVQSAALVAARCLPHPLPPQPAAWLDSYRALLDAWRLWWARCSLETWLCAAAAAAAAAAAPAPHTPPRQVVVACGYCGKSVAGPGGPRPRAQLQRPPPPPAAKMKQVSVCPNCRKPLPRCAICCVHLGTAAGGAGMGAGGGAGAAGAGAGAGAGGAGASFGGWFTWCVACRHGGHAQHMLEWFKEHTECPVSSCSCRCSSLDPPDRP